MENPQDLGVDIAVTAVLEVLEHKRIEPAPSGTDFIGVVDCLEPIVGQVLNE